MSDNIEDIHAPVTTARPDTPSNPAKKQQVTGGDMAVTNVSLKTCKEYPSRQLVVEWNSPTTKPQGYVIKLYEVNPNQISMCVESFLMENPMLETFRFIELKTSTEYICEVSPQYGNDLQPGSGSNQKKTGPRVKSILESDADFGKPRQINHIEKIDETNIPFVTLKWVSSHIGENYKMKSCKVEVSPTRRFSVPVFKSNLPPKTESVCIGKLKHGQQYNVLFTTKCMDLDTPDRVQKFTTEYQFCTNSSEAVIKPCYLKDGMITFSWEPVANAKFYRLVIKDEELIENLSQDETVTGEDCKAKVKISEKLCVGRTCMTKVYTYANNKTSETEWKNHLIGGELVPRNVKSIKNTDEPDRSILVTFDAPKRGPADKYKIFIVPQYGKKKTAHTRDTTNVIQYLRKGMKYKFIVSAKHGDEWSECAESTPLQTSGGDKENPVLSIKRTERTQFNMCGAQFTGKTTQVNIHKGNEFGKVRDLTTTEISHRQDDKYLTELSWKVPSFDNKARDYKVETYKVEIRRKDYSELQVFYLEFQKELQVYKTEAVILNLGENYEMLVSAVYIDIDNDEEYISPASRMTLQTRPCKPAGLRIKILKGANENDELEIEWHSSNGAESYRVEIFIENLYQGYPLFKDEVKGTTTWKRKFDGVFGYGITYYAVITAVGNDGKTNSTKTDLKTIGDNFAPKMVQASIDDDKVTDRNTQVYLSWEQPAEPPEVYEIMSEDAKDLGVISCNDTNKLITGLKAGVSYTFRVVAIRNNNRSGASLSNRVKTNPTPTKVQGVRTRKGPNPSTSIKILWGKADAEKLNKSTKYLVFVSTLDDKIKNEINVTEEHVIVEGLLPGTKYFTTVAGGNSEGFGRNSEKEYFETELGVPKNAELLNDPRSMSTSLILQFTEAEGKPEKYFAGLIKYNNRDLNENLHYTMVKSGDAFDDLEPNTKYIAIMYAAFEDNTQGKVVKSKPMLTAPSKVEIYNYGFFLPTKVCSSRELFLKWKSDAGCREHEVLIRHGDEVESHQIVKNIYSLTYSCLHEASRYYAQIRTKNVIFGPWSDEVPIDLAPAKLTDIKTTLEESDNRILIEFKKPIKDGLSYFYQPICNDIEDGNPIELKVQDAEQTISHHFKPIHPAQKYIFTLWAQDTRGIPGESTLSSSVISRPATGKIIKVERMEEKPNSDINISWKPLARCDEYQVKIVRNGEKNFENIVLSTEKNCSYRCKHPGSIYNIRVRGCRESIQGNWSDKVAVILAPAEVELLESRDELEPVETIQVKWKELQPKPKEYHIILYQKGETVDEDKSETNEYHFKKNSVKPGSLYHCTVAAFNEAGGGKPVKTLNYRIKWNIPRFLLVTADKNDPSTRAIITWHKPENVDSFKLKIVNNQTGAKLSVKLEETTYIFESGIPGNSYSIRLYSGCEDHFPAKYLQKTMTMNGTRQDSVRETSTFIDDETRNSSFPKDGQWKQIKDVNIWYQKDKPLRPKSKVFHAIRKDPTGNDEKIVVKFIPDFIEENKRELECLKKLVGRSNVVTYYQSGFCNYPFGKAIFIAMERCETETLYERIQSQKSKEQYTFQKWKEDIQCIATGLQYLKKCQIIHRDLKPHNILFRGDFPVISDFGLSKKHDEKKSFSYQSDNNIGTFGWVAPEAYGEGGLTSYEADTYAAGLIFFFILTGGMHPYGEVEKQLQLQCRIIEDTEGKNCNLTGLTKLPDGVTKLPDGVTKLPDGVVAFDLISSMLKRKRQDRPSIEAILDHSFFWDEEKKMNFLFDVYKTIESVKKQTFSNSINELRKYKYGKELKVILDWRKALDLPKNLVAAMQKKNPRTYGDSITELLRYARNACAHANVIRDEAGNVLTKGQLYKLFSDALPYFFIYVYHWYKDHFTEDESDNNYSINMVKLLYSYKLRDIVREKEKSEQGGEATHERDGPVQT